MNRGRLILFVGVGAVVLILVIFLTWLGLRANQTGTSNSVTYTDSLSGSTITAFPNKQTGDGENKEPMVNNITITGLDDFFSTSVNQDQATSILNDLTTFIRSRIGTAAGGRAAVFNSRIDKTNTNPATYHFTLVLLQPESRYDVTITLPGDALAPEVTFSGVNP